MFLMAAVAVASSVLFSACSEGSTENDTPAAEIKVKSSAITASADEAEYTIEYTIAGGGMEKSKIASAAAGEEWIIIEEENQNSILVGLTENTSAESRTGTVTLSYKGAPDVYVVILQNGASGMQTDANMRFDIEILKSDAWSVQFTITPTTQSTYFYGIVDKHTYNAHGPEFAINQFIEGIKAEIERNPSYTVDDFLAKGAEKYEFTQLWSMTDYCIVAFDLNSEYGYSGNVTRKEFTTDVAAPSANYFNITADGAKITVKPKITNMKYLFDAVDIEHFSQFPMIYYLAYDCMARLYENGTIANRLATGEASRDFSAELDTDGFEDFVAFAFESDGNYNFEAPGFTENTITYVKFHYDPSSSDARIAGTSQSVLPKTFIGKTIEK